MSEIRHGDLVDLTFEVAEQIAQWLIESARTHPDDLRAEPGESDVNNGRMALTWAAFQIRFGKWRESWDRDPSRDDPRDPMAMMRSAISKRLEKTK